MHNKPAIVIIEHAGPDGESKAIGPFATGDDAYNWAFKNLTDGVQWYWMPLDAPHTM